MACGELHADDGTLRVALEDELGAGAVAAATGLPLSPEARAAAGAFEACREVLEEILADCESGRELVEAGYPDDPRLAARLDGADLVPLLRDGELVPTDGALP